jgi:hypothetical protein
MSLRTYINLAIAPVILGFLVNAATYFLNIHLNAQFLVVFCIIYILISAAAGGFSSYKEKRARASNLMLPASVEEKWLLEFCNIFIFIPVSTFVISIFGHLIGELTFYQETTKTLNIFNQIFKLFNGEGSLLILAGISIGFYGSLLFKKQSYIKVPAILMVVMIVFIIIQTNRIMHQNNLVMSLVQEGNGVRAFSEYLLSYDHHTGCWYNTIMILIPVFFTAISYIRLKKEETI